MAGSGCLATAKFFILKSRIDRGEEVTESDLQSMSNQDKFSHEYPLRLASMLFWQGETEKDQEIRSSLWVRTRDALKEARRRILQQLMHRPDDPELLKELGVIESEIVEVEERLSS